MLAVVVFQLAQSIADLYVPILGGSSPRSARSWLEGQDADSP
jgi:hypothetical protein